MDERFSGVRQGFERQCVPIRSSMFTITDVLLFYNCKRFNKASKAYSFYAVDTSDSRYWLSCSPWFGCYLNCIQRGFFGIGCVGFRLSDSLRCWFRMGIFEPSCWSFHQWIRFGLHGRLRSLFSTRFDRQFVRLRCLHCRCLFDRSCFFAKTTLPLIVVLLRLHLLQRFFETRVHFAVRFGDLNHRLRIPILFIS